MELYEFQERNRVVATATVVDNLGRSFPAGTEFIIDEVDTEGTLYGPCLYPAGSARCDATWFYWAGSKYNEIPACAGKFERVSA